MHTRGAKEELAILLPNTMSHAFHNGRHVVFEPEDEGPGLLDRLRAVLTWIVDLPMRRPVLDEVSALSQQELADLGLTQAELARGFDRSAAPDRGRQYGGGSDCLNWASAV